MHAAAPGLWAALEASATQRKLIRLRVHSVRGTHASCKFARAAFPRFRVANKKIHQMAKPRPKYLDLFRIRLPLPGWVSILHRVSGALLFLFLPLLLWLWQQSLATQESFARFSAVVATPVVKLVLLGLLWAYLHHLCAGFRHLVLDVHIGTELRAARASSAAVFVVSIGLTLLIGVALW